MKIVNHKIEGVDYVPSKSFSNNIDPKFIILHYTAGRSYLKSRKVLTEGDVSSHFLVGKSGEVSQLVLLNKRAWHAGKSYWKVENKEYTGLNSVSWGIEIDNPGKLEQIGQNKWKTWFGEIVNDPSEVYTHVDGTHWGSYPKICIEKVIDLLVVLCKYKNIPVENILSHELISPGRKSDTGPALDLNKIRKIVKERL